MLGNRGFRHDMQEPTTICKNPASWSTTKATPPYSCSACKCFDKSCARTRALSVLADLHLFDVPICNPEISRAHFCYLYFSLFILGRKEFQTSMAVLGYTGNTNKLWVPCPKSDKTRRRIPGAHIAKKQPSPEFQPQEQIACWWLLYTRFHSCMHKEQTAPIHSDTL